MDRKIDLSWIESTAFVFDLKSILIETPSAFSAPKVSPSTLGRLEYLSKLTNGAVAILSDRELTKVQGIMHPVADEFTLIGSHGGEIKERHHEAKISEAHPGIELARREINSFVSQLKPAYVENRELSVAVHFGPAPELSGTIYKKLTKIAKTLGNDIQVIEGHYCWELKESNHNKGKAISQLSKTENFAGKSLYFFGADESSEPAFLATKLLKGQAVLVGEFRRNTRAQKYLESSAALEDWLRELSITQSIPAIGAGSSSRRSAAA